MTIDLPVEPGRTDDGRPEAAPLPTFQEILDQEKVEVPAHLRTTAWVDLGSEDIPIERYTSKAFYDLEMERLWPKVWQMACREEDLLDVGDTVVYDVGRYSTLLVRTSEDEIKAYPNACLHRGTQLREKDGRVSELRCPFHGICWNLNGSLKEIPCAWDFPHVDQAQFGLPEFKVATFEGSVYINMDPEAPPLEDYLGDLTWHLGQVRPALSNRFKAVHVGRPLRANWKVAQEAFLEAYHVTYVHPQTLMFSGDGLSEYSIYPGQPHWNRLVTPLGVPSPYLGPDIGDQDVVDALQSQAFLRDNIGEEQPADEVPEGKTARDVLSESFRTLIGSLTGFDGSALTNSEVLDNLQYALFPNVQHYIGLAAGLVMRFRPWGNDPEVCLMEVMFLYPLPEGARIHGVAMQMLDFDEPWANAPALGAFASALEQDMLAIPRVQRGLQTMTKPGITLSRYQESKIRHFHQTLDQYLRP